MFKRNVKARFERLTSLLFPRPAARFTSRAQGGARRARASARAARAFISQTARVAAQPPPPPLRARVSEADANCDS